MIATQASRDVAPVRDYGLVCCAVGDRQYALRGTDVRVISRAEHLCVAPGDDGRIGTLSIGGAEVPVYSLARLLGHRTSVAISGRHIAVTGDGPCMVGWMVDFIARVPVPPGATVTPLPALLGSPATTWFDAVLGLTDRSLLLLAPDRLDPRAPSLELPAYAAQPPAGSSTGRGAGMAVLFKSAALPDCGTSRCALTATSLEAVVQGLPTVTVPGSTASISGLATWHDALVPVLDFRAASDREGRGGRYLVARTGPRHGGVLVTFRVDADVALHRASVGDRPLPQDGVAPPFVRGVFDIGGEPVALIDLDRLLD